MKRKIIVRDKDKSKEIEIEVRDQDHINACRKYRTLVWRKRKGEIPRHAKYKQVDQD